MPDSKTNDDQDYLSEAFLSTQTPETETSYARKRLKKEWNHKVLHEPQSKLIQQQQQLESVLHAESVLSPSNKGFKMMQKMGFKDGDTLGREGESALLAPIKVSLKTDRKGLGSIATTASASSLLTAAQREHMQASLAKRKARFDQSVRDKTAAHQLERDVQVARAAVRDLDEKNGKVEETELWPVTSVVPTLHLDPGIRPKEVDQHEFESLDLEEQMDILTEYLRSNYLYCQWCAIEFDDEQDMLNNCPGDDRRDHDD